MSRYTGPKCRLCRREGVKLFLKGDKCESDKCPLFRRQQAPGQHGRLRRRPSAYLLQLREKQKVKRIYGVWERQFRRYIKLASKDSGGMGVSLLKTLESRLDNVVFLLGMALSRSHARQSIGHGKITVNGSVASTASLLVKSGDTIGFSGEGDVVREVDPPAWLKWNGKKKVGKIERLPEENELDQEINTQLIVEFYSRQL